VVAASLHPASEYRYEAPACGIRLAVVDEEQLALIVGAAVQPIGTEFGQDGPDCKLPIRRDLQHPVDAVRRSGWRSV
jgi:hypothetical protein